MNSIKQILTQLTALILAVIASLAADFPVVADQPAPDLYFGPGATGGLYRVNLDDLSSVQQIVSSSLVNTSTGVALDYLDRKIYWIADTQSTSVDKIRRANLDGTDIELFLLPNGQPADLKIDPYHGQLYWTSRVTNSLDVIDLDGSNQHQLVATAEPRGLDIDLMNDHLYWVEFARNRLRRADLDGSNVIDVITSGMSRPFDVAVDPLNERLYWAELGPATDNSEGRVWRANLDGTSPTLIAEMLYQPVDVAIDVANGFVYWGVGGSLYRVDLDGSNLTQFPFPNGPYVNLALDVPPIVPEPSSFAIFATLIAVAVCNRCRCSVGCTIEALPRHSRSEPFHP